MKIKKEILVGLISIIGISGLIVGFFFLKGQELWKNRALYYAVYDNTEGLTTGRPVKLNGLKIGNVINVAFQPTNFNSVVVEFELTDPYVKEIPIGSTILLNSDLLSGAYLELVWKDNTDNYQPKDTISSLVSQALEDQINERLLPLEQKTNELISTADSAIKTIEAIFSRNTDNLDQSFEGINNSIRNFERVSLRIDTLIKSEKYRISRVLQNIESITSNLNASNQQITALLSNVSKISDTLANVDFIGLVDNAKESLDEVNTVLYDIQHGDGSLTHLLQDSSLYNRVDDMVDEATRLVENIKTHPNRYLQFSVFGSRDKSLLDSRDEKTLKKFVSDSLDN